ncbi:hypothetical protein MAR_021624 [Mya arenaria]|uniref:Uncharacterized protein n=1 Tax=Mya arenaria TaxID=6604 RepID=A0ABY7E8T7_MYAAR|nr:hypothetical protein MAR_021624 [Mya arenaria]
MKDGVPADNEIVQEHTRYEDLNNLNRKRNGEYSDLVTIELVEMHRKIRRCLQYVKLGTPKLHLEL